MKKLILCASLFCCALSASAQSNTITLYGKNEGYETTTRPDGSQTTILRCDNFYSYKCAEIATTGPILTRGVSFNLATYTEEGEVDKSEDFDNFQGIEGNGNQITIYSGNEIED